MTPLSILKEIQSGCKTDFALDLIKSYGKDCARKQRKHTASILSYREIVDTELKKRILSEEAEL